MSWLTRKTDQLPRLNPPSLEWEHRVLLLPAGVCQSLLRLCGGLSL